MIAEAGSPKAERDREDRNVTFGSYADDDVQMMSPSWRNPKHIAPWKMTLTVYAAPIRKLVVEEIGTDEILRVLKPHWSRVLGRI